VTEQAKYCARYHNATGLTLLHSQRCELRHFRRVPLRAAPTESMQPSGSVKGHAPCVTMLKASLASSACSSSLNSPHRDPT